MPLNFSCASAASFLAAANFASYSAFTESKFGACGCEEFQPRAVQEDSQNQAELLFLRLPLITQIEDCQFSF